jgi:hypothetical protein
VRRSDTKDLSIAEIHVSERSLANAHRVREYGLEDRLQLPGRSRDDLQHLRGRGLLLQRFGQLARALLLGFEQPHVLNRDYSLVGERPEKRNLLICKRINFGTSKLNRSDRHPLAE